jgi:hypothetical protein
VPAFLRDICSFRFCRRVLTGVVAVYVAASLTLGGTRAARPVFHALVAAWVVLCLGLQLRRLRSPSRPATLPELELVAWNLVLAVVLAEFSLRALAAWTGPSLLLGATLDAHRLTPGHDYGGGLRGNNLGYPGPDFRRDKPPGTLRIAALGDSFAVGPAVPFADNYLTLLADRLPGAQVYNFGVSGAGPREYHAVLQGDVWAYQPDLVLVSVFVGNDITETLPTPRYLDPRQHSLYLLLTRGWRLAREPRRSPPDPGPSPAPGLSPQTFREIEGRRLAVCLTPPGPAMEKKWRRALADLDRIVRDCRRRNVPVAVVLIPDEFQVNPAVRAEAMAEARVSERSLDLELPQRRLTGFFADRGVPCLDLLPHFRGAADTYAPRDTHWNRRGNRLAAERIGPWLAGLTPSACGTPRTDSCCRVARPMPRGGTAR